MSFVQRVLIKYNNHNLLEGYKPFVGKLLEQDNITKLTSILFQSLTMSLFMGASPIFMFLCPSLLAFDLQVKDELCW